MEMLLDEYGFIFTSFGILLLVIFSICAIKGVGADKNSVNEERNDGLSNVLDPSRNYLPYNIHHNDNHNISNLPHNND
jgi:hypothetical protein